MNKSEQILAVPTVQYFVIRFGECEFHVQTSETPKFKQYRVTTTVVEVVFSPFLAHLRFFSVPSFQLVTSLRLSLSDTVSDKYGNYFSDEFRSAFHYGIFSLHCTRADLSTLAPLKSIATNCFTLKTIVLRMMNPCLRLFPAFVLAAAAAVAAFVLPAAESLSVSPHSRTESATPNPRQQEGSFVLEDSCENDSHTKSNAPIHKRCLESVPRRRAIQNMLLAAGTITAAAASTPLVSNAYTPDPDKLQESLYFISRVQEATVQQERFMNKLGGTQQLRSKLQLTLRLVDKNYKLLDQINYSSAFVTPNDKLVEASEAGYEAVDALQAAIEFVKKEDNWKEAATNADDAIAKERIAFLTECMQTCRSQLLVYTEFMPTEKLKNARYRVENENIQNRDEFDGDEDAGVYNPVNLPWKPVLKATEAYKPKVK